jgi:hypothetical protein
MELLHRLTVVEELSIKAFKAIKKQFLQQGLDNQNNIKIQNCFLAVDQQSHLIQSFGCR